MKSLQIWFWHTLGVMALDFGWDSLAQKAMTRHRELTGKDWS